MPLMSFCLDGLIKVLKDYQRESERREPRETKARERSCNIFYNIDIIYKSPWDFMQLKINPPPLDEV